MRPVQRHADLRSIGRDPVRNVVVVHGGISSSGTAFDETLEWDGRDWTVHVAGDAGPGAREGAGLAYEPDTGRMLLFGGAVGFEQRADTWAWDGETWSLVTQTGPRPRFVSLMTEDRATGDVLLQGGHWVAGNDGDFLADTWRWDGDTWIEITGGDGPGKRVNAPGTWDERLGGIVMFGGGVGEREPNGIRHVAVDGRLDGARVGDSAHTQRWAPGCVRCEAPGARARWRDRGSGW